MGEVKNIYFTNIKCTGENGVYVGAESAAKISNIYFDGVDVLTNKTTSIPGGFFDRRPADVPGIIKANTSGFYFDKAASVTVRNCSVQWGDNKQPYFAHGLESRNVKKLAIVNLAGEPAFPGKLKAIVKFNDLK